MDLDTLFDAAIAGNADAIAQLEMQADRHYHTILHVESEKGNTEHVRFILTQFANKNLLTKINIFKHTALHLAIYHGGHTEVAKVLIDAARHLPSSSEANETTQDNPVTPFQAFLRQGDINMDTALHAAVMKGHVAIVKLLVEADPMDRHIQNDDGKTPMYIAVEKGLNEIVEIISTTCIAPSLHGPDCSTVVRINNLNQVNSPGGTLYKIMYRDAVFDAAIEGNADARARLERGADKLDEDDRSTILHTESMKGNAEHVRFILEEFASKNLLVKLGNQKETALTWAAYFGHTQVAEVLIDAARHLPPSDDDNPITSFQAFLRRGDEDGNTALHIAANRGSVATAKLLVEDDQGGRNIQNNEGKTPMYIAAEKGYTDMLKMMCTTSIALSDLDGPAGGSTVFHAAVKNHNHDIEVVKVLIAAARLLASSSSDNESTSFQDFLRRGDEDGNTALHIAVMQGNLATAKLLLEADPSDRRMPNKQGKTPFYTAVERRDVDMVKMICTTSTAQFSLRGPGGRLTALHAVIKNLDQAKKEVRDVLKMIFDLIKSDLIKENQDIDEYTLHRVFVDQLYFETDDGQTILELVVERNYAEVLEVIFDVQNHA